MNAKLLFSLLLVGITCLAPAQTPAPLPPPAQDQGLPYTRSARSAALAKIRNCTAVFEGSRYAYVRGFKVRLDPGRLRAGEAASKNGRILAPAAFVAVLDMKTVTPPPAPDGLDDRWVYDIGLRAADGPPVDLAALAETKGLKVYQHPRGLLLIGREEITFAPGEEKLLDCVITLFDTPEKIADPDIAMRSIPALARQGKWTDHVKVTPEQLVALGGPETEWPTAREADYDFKGFNQELLGSAVPAAGVYPRLLFSEKDIPMLAARVKATRLGRMSLIEMEHLFSKSWWDPATSDGQVFHKLATGNLTGLEWDVPHGTPASGCPHTFKGQKPGIQNSHVAYVPECLTAMALYCLITGDEALGKQVAAAVANYFRLREPMVDDWLEISDSEFGSSMVDPATGALVSLNGAGASTHWRNIHGIVAHMNLALSLDFAGRWMNADQKETMRRVIAKATYGRRSYAQDAPVRFRDVNWMGWDLPHFLAVAAIEGLPGFDPEAYEAGAESLRAFCDWGIDGSGVVFESNGKSPGSFQFITLSMVTLARRGENLFGHPHWRKLLEGQIQMTSPSGRVTVNSGTQYSPYSRQPLGLTLVSQLKGFYPESRLPDYLISKAIGEPGADQDEFLRAWTCADASPDAYRRDVGNLKRLRLPSITYPGFVRAVLYDGDTVATTRADLDLPLDFNAPVSGVFSSYSDRSCDAVWMNLYVRPNHYLGAGHHHADAGMFHFSALGVDWFTQSPFHQAYDGKFFNLVQVDGKSEAENIPGATNGYNAAAKYLGATVGESASVASADLTYAYSWRWNTQPPQVWSDELKAMDWELEPSPDNLRIWAGTARYKLRPWWSNHTYSNFIPTSRAKFNPMQYVFRSTALIRGAHPYGIVIDDLKKDESPHLYQWAAMLNGGVWQAEMPGLGSNCIALAWRAGDPDVFSSAVKPLLKPKPGDPLLLVFALGMEGSGESGRPLFQVETVPGQPDRNGKTQFHDRLMINQRANSVGFRVLLLPVRAGEPLPVVACDVQNGTADVRWPNQADELRFKTGDDRRTRLSASRGKTLLIP